MATATSDAAAVIAAAQDRLTNLGTMSSRVYLEPFVRLVDRSYQCYFIAEQIQRQLLHVTTGATQFHFYEESSHHRRRHHHDNVNDNNNDDTNHDNDDDNESRSSTTSSSRRSCSSSRSSSHTEEEDTTIDIVPHWHVQKHDFLFSKSKWDPIRRQIEIHMIEQDPISVSVVPQISKTIAFKGQSQEAILQHQQQQLPSTTTMTATTSNNNNDDDATTKEKDDGAATNSNDNNNNNNNDRLKYYYEIKDSPAPTLMELNQQTFDRVLNRFVTPHQKRRYQTEGHALRFGPDILVGSPPSWVETPIQITKVHHNNNDSNDNNNDDNDHDDSFYYLWQSPYTTSATSLSSQPSPPPPFVGGYWYGKPLSPAQAYEWIVFDAFKPF